MEALLHVFLLTFFIWVRSASPQTEDQDVWIPNLRGLPIGRDGEIVAEFEIASSPIRQDVDDDYEDIYQRLGKDEYEPCVDPDSSVTLYPLDSFQWNARNFQRPLTLKTEARKLTSGRFSTRNSNTGGSSSYQSVVIEGRCCWEAFSRASFRGRMLRLCRGKYSANILGNLANNIQSIRPVE